MRLRYIRWGLAATAFAMLFAFYAPIVPFSFRVICNGTYSLCPIYSISTSLNSITAALHYWGASFGFQTGGYYTGDLSLGTLRYFIGTTGWTTPLDFPGLVVIFLGACSLMILLSPEIVDGTHSLSLHFSHQRASTYMSRASEAGSESAPTGA